MVISERALTRGLQEGRWESNWKSFNLLSHRYSPAEIIRLYAQMYQSVPSLIFFIIEYFEVILLVLSISIKSAKLFRKCMKYFQRRLLDLRRANLCLFYMILFSKMHSPITLRTLHNYQLNFSLSSAYMKNFNFMQEYSTINFY